MTETETPPHLPRQSKRKEIIKTTVLFLLLSIITIGIVVIGVKALNARDTIEATGATQTGETVTGTSCELEENKPILIILLNGQEAGATCTKDIGGSQGRYFAYYGQPPFDYVLVCSTTVNKVLQYDVYDAVPKSIDPKQRYSYTYFCPSLRNGHHLPGAPR